MSSMRTRGAVGFKIDGELKLTENQFDSMPSRVGKELLEWFKKQDVTALAKTARTTQLFETDDSITDLDAIAHKDLPNIKAGRTWGQTLNGLRFPKTLEAGVMIDANKFPEDSVSCEWTYIIDFDLERIDVYMGYQTKPHDDGDFNEAGSRTATDGQEFYPSRLICGWYFDALPASDQFVTLTERRAVEAYKESLV